MNFFEAQERARKSSRYLVLWFALSVLGVILVMYLAAVAFWQLSSSNPQGIYHATDTSQLRWWNEELFLGVAVLVGGVILIGSLFKLSQLSAGGRIVASSLGGRQLDPGTRDLRERRLLNVVEEMAIASGVPVPGVWVMDDERGINAFAAGTDPANAVIGVTRGTLERLTRSELQGVVAHEFSHILNGDMKLNIRLMGWIFGLVMLATLGRIMIQSIRFVRGSRDSKGNSGGIVLAICVAGLAVWLVGSIGVLFSRLLQAAISRQREYLADASAVQFTRDPSGIASALKKIGGFSAHGSIRSPKAAEVRHMFFAGSSLSSWMATHPPLEKRIQAIDPMWDGNMDEANPVNVDSSEFDGTLGFAEGGSNASRESQSDLMGSGDAIDIKAAAMLLSQMEADHLRIRSKSDAKCILLGMLVLVNGEELARTALQGLAFTDEAISNTLDWSRKTRAHSNTQKLALVDLSITWFRSMGGDEACRFIAASKALIEADGEIDLFEFMLQKVIERNVEIGLGLRALPAMKYRRLADLEPHVSALLAAFSQLAGKTASLASAQSEFRQHTGLELNPCHVGISEVALALQEMDATTPLVKQQILRLCALVATHDRNLDDSEFVLLRAAAEAMGAPIPPMIRILPES